MVKLRAIVTDMVGITGFLKGTIIIGIQVQEDIVIFERDTIEGGGSTIGDGSAPTVRKADIIGTTIAIGIDPTISDKLVNMKDITNPGGHNRLIVMTIRISRIAVRQPLGRIIGANITKRVERAQLETDAVGGRMGPPFSDGAAARIRRWIREERMSGDLIPRLRAINGEEKSISR